MIRSEIRSLNTIAKKYFVFILFSFLFPLDQITGQIIIDEPPKPIYYERTMRIKKFKDMKDMRDVFHYDKFLLGRNRISGNFSYNTGRVVIDDGHSKHNEVRSAIGFYSRIRFVEEFSINTTFYKDFNPRAMARWIADYTYSIGRYNWRANKFNYGYENYLNNKYSNNFKEFSEKFMEGYYFVSYNHFPKKLNAKIKLDNTTSLRIIYFARYSIMYRNEKEEYKGGLFYGKPTVGGAFRLTLFRNIYIESAVYYYFHPAKRQPWDPDYSYGFGYFDWRSFRCSITYGNWAVNRFPWFKPYYPTYGFPDGNFKFMINWIW